MFMHRLPYMVNSPSANNPGFVPFAFTIVEEGSDQKTNEINNIKGQTKW